MASSTYFTAFKETCETHIKPWEFEAYCEPIRARAESAYKIVEPAAEWVREATAPIVKNAKWTWEKAGEHYGPPAQMLLVVLVLGIAYNLFGGGKKPKSNETCRDELMNRLIREQMERDPTFFQRQAKTAASAA